MSTYTRKGLQPHPPGPDGTKCYCTCCAEWKWGPRIPNGIPYENCGFAGYTCNWCPNASGPLENMHSFNNYENTERCTPCSRLIKSWQRAGELADDMIALADSLGMRMRFVGLTVPNYTDKHAGLADLKKKVRNFRYRNAFKAKVAGGCDFYEWTQASDGTYNVHYHGVWIGKFWNQEDLTHEWGEGHTWIELIKKKHEAYDTVRYATKYLNKQKEYGIRCKQKFGDLYRGSSQTPSGAGGDNGNSSR